jgi:hypothetical protein
VFSPASTPAGELVNTAKTDQQAGVLVVGDNTNNGGG